MLQILNGPFVAYKQLFHTLIVDDLGTKHYACNIRTDSSECHNTPENSIYIVTSARKWRKKGRHVLNIEQILCGLQPTCPYTNCG
jgi:hypothetical protein